MRIYFDSNIFIHAFESETDLGHAARRAFALMDDERAVGVTSQLTLAEILPRPLREKDVQLEHFYEAIFAGRPRFETLPLTLPILRSSARLVVEHGLRLADALHVATAIDSACGFFLSEDRGLKVPAGLTLISLAHELFT